MAKGLLELRGLLMGGLLGRRGPGSKPRRQDDGGPYVLTDYVDTDYVSETP